MGLRTTTTGWFPKPPELRRARWRFAEGEIDAAALHAAEDRATAEAINLQLRLGLDVLVEGQMERSDPVAWFADALEGTEPAGLVRIFENLYCRRPRFVGEVTRPGPVSVERWERASGSVSRPLRAVLTGPYTMMDWSFDEHYRSRERACLALAEVVRAEAEDLVAAGAVELQLDEPAITTRPEEMILAAEALTRVTERLHGRARLWVHVCLGRYEPVLEQLLALPADVLMLDLSGAGPVVLEGLADLPASRELAAGVVDPWTAAVEDEATVVARAERVLAHVPAERLWLAPDAALRTLRPETAEAKLLRLTSAASRLG